MAEQAIETAAINWAPVHPMGSRLGAWQEEGILGRAELGPSCARGAGPAVDTTRGSGSHVLPAGTRI